MFKFNLFSYWLFIWFIFNYIGIIKASPLIFLIIGLIGVIIFLLIIRKINKFIKNIIITNIYIKVIPIFLIIKFPLIAEEDLLFGFFLAYIYIIYLLYNNKNPIDVYLKLNIKNLLK